MNKTGSRRLPAYRLFSKFLSLAVALAFIFGPGVAQASAMATTIITNVSQPIDLLAFVPCAAQGAGEFVQLSGSLHVLFTTVLDDSGGFHTRFQNQPQGASGTGLTTGDKYQGVGETGGSFNGQIGSEATFINNFNLIGQGPGNNFLVHETFHITISPSGEITALVDYLSVECRIPDSRG